MSTTGVDTGNKSQKKDSCLETDLVIIGGGACGVAVVAHMIERFKQGRKLQSITLIEKNESIGPGLAYSAACIGTNLNMQANAAGIYADDPEHFTRWMGAHFPNMKDTHFPPRQNYGDYLSSVLVGVTEDAERLGVTFRIVNDEAVDLGPVDQRLEITLARGARIKTTNVVLAFGNFSSTFHPELVGSPGFISPVWPLSRLDVIPSGAPVSILGSSLTAMDAVIFLAENGHKGPITLVSRNGRLPKVQGIASRFQRRYVMHSLARDLETSDGGALDKVINTIKRELESLGWHKQCEWSEIKAPKDPLLEFRSAIKSAEDGDVSWQSVLRATAPVVERYWNCMNLKEKETLLQDYMGIWFHYRHGMTLENARKVLTLIEKGQLRVVHSASKTRWDCDHFSVAADGGDIQSKYFIEAAGQTFNAVSIELPLMKRLLGKRLLTPHPAGGISVDFSTLLASNNIYVIGSMTRGTHFFTNSVDRSANHAGRIADSVTGLSPRRPLHLALFVGSQLFSQLMLCKIVPRLIEQGHTPYIFFSADEADRKAKSRDLHALGDFERQLLQDDTIPFFGSFPSDEAASLISNQIRANYGILVERVASVNDPSMLKSFREHHIDAGLSLRCGQRFGQEMIDHFADPRTLLNLHAGILPSHRGETASMGATPGRKPSFGCSLHHVSSSSNPGPVLDIRTAPSIDHEKSMLHHMDDVYQVGEEMVMGAVDSFARGNGVPAIEQDGAETRSYSFPTKEDLETVRERGWRLVDAGAIEEMFVGSFAGNGARDALREVVKEAVREWMDCAGWRSRL